MAIYDGRCEYCKMGKPLVIGKTNDQGICLRYITKGWIIEAYGYDVLGSESNGLGVKINYCPVCGRYLGGE